MRLFRIGILSAFLCIRLPASLLPPPNLAKRIESAEAIIVARLTSGMTIASGSQVSSELALRVDRVLKGNLIPGSEIAAHLEGRGLFVFPNTKQSPIAEPLYGIWFLSSAARPYTVIARDENYGELHFAPIILPGGAPPGNAGDTPGDSVANELASALRWIAENYSTHLNPRAEHNGTPQERMAAAPSLTQFRSLAEDIRTLKESTILPIYRQFSSDRSPHLRAVGIAGLIVANDPEGVKRAAADWSELAASADINPVIASLMSYSTGSDAEAVLALGALALRDPAEPGLRENAVYALRAIHTKETLPALIALLDYKETRLRLYALSGVCLFVRSAPTITPQSVPLMPWLQSQQPAPLLNSETERYCPIGGVSERTADLDAYASFWKSWWGRHQIEIEER